MPNALLESVKIEEGKATLVFNEAVTDPSFTLSLLTAASSNPVEVTSALLDDGKSLELTSDAITATSALSFVGSVTAGGAPVDFNFIKATSLTGARAAVGNSKMSFSVMEGNDLTIEGTHAAFGSENDSISLLKADGSGISHPTIDLGAGDDKVIAASGSVLSSHTSTAIDAGTGHDTLEFSTQSFSLLFGLRTLSLDSYNFSHFEEVNLPYGTLLNKPLFGSVLTLNLGTKNAFDTLTFGSKACTDYNQNGDMAVISGNATGVVINGMAEHTTVNFNGGVNVPTTAFTMKGVKDLDVNFTTDKAVDMTFGTLTLSNAENLSLDVKDNGVANSINIADMKVTNLHTLTLKDADANDGAALTVNGTASGGGTADFSAFKGTLSLTDNVGFATIRLADAHANALTLKADNAANVIEYKAAQGTGDTIANFETAHDALRFAADLNGSILFSTEGGATSVYVDANQSGSIDAGDNLVITLTGTAGFSADNITFAAN